VPRLNSPTEINRTVSAGQIDSNRALILGCRRNPEQAANASAPVHEKERAMFEGFERKVVLVDGLDIACAVVRVV